MTELKRTKSINRDRFRKRRPLLKLAPLALAVMTLTACGGNEPNENLTIYESPEACFEANPNMGQECYNAYESAKLEAISSAPKFASQADCEAEFGAAACQTVSNENGERQQYQSSGSMWMPLIAGYMFGRMSSGMVAQKPLYTPQAGAGKGQFYDATGKSYGAATPGKTVSVPKGDLKPAPKTTRTLKRGGFGQVVANQQYAAQSKKGTSSRSSSRSFGG